MLSKPANLYEQRRGSIHLVASAEVAEVFCICGICRYFKVRNNYGSTETCQYI